MNRGLFLDRDGVVAELVYYPSHGEWESARDVADLQMRPGAAEAVKEATAVGWLVFLITNQPSYAKGKCTLESLQHVQQQIVDNLRGEGAVITEAFVCYHHPQSVVAGFGVCQCRKPSPYFILQAAEKYDIDLRQSWMAGDQDTDVEAGRRAGCRTALIKYEHSGNKRGKVEPDLVCADLAELVRKIN